jgi:DNA-binding protein HU-beta
MTKKDIVKAVSDKTGIPQVDVIIAIESFFNEVKSSLVSGDEVTIREFGSFILKTQKAKIGRNIKKNTAIQIPEQVKPAFKPSKDLVAAVRNTEAENKE